MFHLFQHASESLLTCWSWFQRTRESSDDSNMKCGFYLKQNLKVSPWSGQLIDLMGCSVSYGQTPFRKQSQNNQTKIWHYAENAGGGLHWFEKPEDATALRSRLLDRTMNVTTWNRPRSSAAPHQLTITIVNRQIKRRLVNSDEITTALRRAYPLALIRTVYMEDLKPIEQFAMWSQMSIVIAPHGAALVNGMFLPPGNSSAVIEIFPRHYYPTFFFGNFLRSCGVRRYGYYNNDSDPEVRLGGVWVNHGTAQLL
jgi:hypothetical protein